THTDPAGRNDALRTPLDVNMVPVCCMIRVNRCAYGGYTTLPSGWKRAAGSIHPLPAVVEDNRPPSRSVVRPRMRSCRDTKSRAHPLTWYLRARCRGMVPSTVLAEKGQDREQSPHKN